jgi:acetyl esterase
LPPPAEPRRPGGWSRAGLIGSGLMVALVIWTLGSTLLPAGSSMIALYGSMAFTLLTPHVAIVALVATALAGAVAVRSRARAGFVLAAFGALGFAATAAIIASISGAARSAGGSVDPLAALTLTTSARRPDSVLTYAHPEGERLKALVWMPEPAARAAPVLLFIAGGGWVSVDQSTFHSDAAWYAQRGWLVISVEYRLAAPGRATWDKAPHDVACALAWAAAHAADLGADPKKIVLIGQSTGGNLALNLGWSAANAAAPSHCTAHDTPPVPRAVVASYPVADPALNYWDGSMEGKAVIPGSTDLYLGGSAAEYPERLRAITSASHLSRDIPPTLVFLPARDDFVPAQGTRSLAAAARRVGADVTLVEVPFANHAFDFAGLGQQFARTVTARFLDSAIR